MSGSGKQKPADAEISRILRENKQLKLENEFLKKSSGVFCERPQIKYTCIKTNGFKYLAVVIDLFSRRVVGWNLSDSMNSDMVIKALHNAVNERKPSPGLIAHSDRGSQYSSHAYQEFLANNRFRCSMSSPGTPYDNACCESFFHSLKVEWLYGKNFLGISDLYSSILHYIEIFYNRQRLHFYLGYLSPVSFETSIA